MDIKKEREAFEKWFTENNHAHFMQFAIMDGIYQDKHSQTCWEAWQAAKSQAVPEGFVLVPRELSADEARKHAEAMFNKVERMARNEHRDLNESEFELFKNRWIDARTLTIQFDWKAMIEAQEQSQ